MRLILVLIALSFELGVTKKYKMCEFAQEIFEKHNVSRNDIFKHMCISSVSLDTSSDGTLVGIYSIGSEWWCGEKEPSGGCNLKCSKLIDDDLSDDVACVKKILSQQGLQAWDTTEQECIEEHRHYVSECLEIIDKLINSTSTTTSTTTSSPVTTTTGSPVTSAPENKT